MNWTKISVFILFVAITYLSLRLPDQSVAFRVNDKFGHALAYCVLTLNLGVLFARNRWFLAVLIAFCYSALMEFLQGYVPGRSVDAYDLVANASGALLAGGVLVIAHGSLRKLLQRLKLYPASL